MKILHIAPLAPYNVGWSYQENLLPKYQRKLGHEVRVVVSPFENGRNGKTDIGEGEFTLEDGVRVYRRRRFLGNNFLGKILSFTNVKDILLDFQPDLIMVHSLITLSVFQAIAYRKKHNPNCVIIQDNHLDENIGWRKNKFFTDLYYGVWALVNRFSLPHVARYYGVTPWRQEFLQKRFRIPAEKTDLLIMGADMDDIDLASREDCRKAVDAEFGTEGHFLLVTGGKIERNKTIAPLMQAVKTMEKTKLLVFGTVADDYKEEIEAAMNDNVVLVGWKNNHQINELFLAADLAVFPGQHSVLWEQACACKTPALFGSWKGMGHVNNGGNSAFLEDTTPEGLRAALEACHGTESYRTMLAVARSEATDVYSYYKIAEKSLEMAQN